MSDERTPHVYRHPSGNLTWMCPSRKKGFVWALEMNSMPTSWGDSIQSTNFMLLPVEDWHAHGWELDQAEEDRILIGGLSTWMNRGWDRVENWP